MLLSQIMEQIDTWIKKYSKKGNDGLKNAGGCTKSGNERSELEKLKVENRKETVANGV